MHAPYLHFWAYMCVCVCVALWPGSVGALLLPHARVPRSYVFLPSRARTHARRASTTTRTRLRAMHREGREDDGAGAVHLPLEVFEKLLENNVTSILEVQRRAFRAISNHYDVLIESPTGTGKTLAYALPLTVKIRDTRQAGANRKGAPPPLYDYTAEDARKRKPDAATVYQLPETHARSRGKSYGDTYSKERRSVSPQVFVYAPTRELAMQIAKEWKKIHKSVAVVYGGVPIERQLRSLSISETMNGKRRRRDVDVLIGTAGRMRELLSERHINFNRVHTVVADEADVLLNPNDQPDIMHLLSSMKHDYQLVCVSATMTKGVKAFAQEVMELSKGSYVKVEKDQATTSVPIVGVSTGPDGETKLTLSPRHGGSAVWVGGEGEGGGGDGAGKGEGVVSRASTRDIAQRQQEGEELKPLVAHQSMSVVATSRDDVTADMILVHSPRKVIIFAVSKAAVDAHARVLEKRLGVGAHIYTLHGDLTQSMRARTMASFRETEVGNVNVKVMVATDVAARGIDVPQVDLVVQYGVPRQSGKEGTFDGELYLHRTGRAGRVGGDVGRTAQAILMYDPTAGEGSLLDPLMAASGVPMVAVTAPTPTKVMRAAFSQALARAQETGDQSVESYFDGNVRAYLESFPAGEERGEAATRLLGGAFAALSNVKTFPAHRSLLTADPTKRTLRIRWADECSEAERQAPDQHITPSRVVTVCKALGSGKIPRIMMLADGSAVFDLSQGKAAMLMDAVVKGREGAGGGGGVVPSTWVLEYPESVDIDTQTQQRRRGEREERDGGGASGGGGGGGGGV